MDEKKLLSPTSLAKRWDYTPAAITNFEKDGIITRNPKFPSPRYSIEEIEAIESIGLDVNPMSPLERRRLEKRIEQLEREKEILSTKLNNCKIALGL